MRRRVEPELLDDLPADDPTAVRSRSDLQRLNPIMRHPRILARLIRGHVDEAIVRRRPIRLVELGAGDGTLLLRLAREWSARGASVQATFLDRQGLVSAETVRLFAASDWTASNVVADAFEWLKQSAPVADVMVSNLFLHHFPDERLQELLCMAAARTNLFVACEPCRAPLAMVASRLLWFAGCNAVTRHDAVVSVRAGFVGHELSALWPSGSGWTLGERPVGWVSHGFLARRNA